MVVLQLKMTAEVRAGVEPNNSLSPMRNCLMMNQMMSPLLTAIRALGLTMMSQAKMIRVVLMRT